MHQFEIKYTGDLHCQAIHLASTTQIESDAPLDNCGRGQAFSPTDLLATSLPLCMFTTIAILGKKRDLDITGAHAKVTKVMSSSPRRISEIIVDVYFPRKFDQETQIFIKNTAENCPVALSLHPDIQQVTRFHF